MGQNPMENNKENNFPEFMVLNTSNTLLLNIEIISIAFHVSRNSFMARVHLP